jgi:hypothetical protein
MKLIPLTQGQFAMVDDCDYESLSKYNWQANKVKSTGNFYATRSKRFSGKRVSLRMHCEIMGEKGIDHKDGNGLNNQRHNLRKCSQLENVRNARKSKRGITSIYKGVCRRFECKGIKYRAQITVNREKIMLGTFDTEYEAALVYDAAAKKHHGSFARLNFSS